MQAAHTVFTRKGFAGARMQEIANEAGINKGLLHYYFDDKRTLFRTIFDRAIASFIPQINELLGSELPLLDKIERLVDSYMGLLLENPHIPPFVINELNTNPEAFVGELIRRDPRPNPLPFMVQIQLETEQGQIRQVHPLHLLIHILSMCVFPFVARPMFQALIGLDDQTYLAFLQSRKAEITSFIRQALVPCEPSS